MNAPVEAKTGDTIGKFKGTVDFSGYTWDVPATGKDAVDEALVGATRGSDDVESVKLYKQKISEVGISADYDHGPRGHDRRGDRQGRRPEGPADRRRPGGLRGQPLV